MPWSVSNVEPPAPPPHGPFSSPGWSQPPNSLYQPSGPAAPGFYPLTIGRGVSVAWHMYRFGWRGFVAISLIAYAPLIVIQAVAQYATYGLITQWEQQALGSPLSRPLDSSVALAQFPWGAFAVLLLIGFATGLFTIFGGAALVHAIIGVIRGRPLSVRGSYRAAFERLPSLLALYLALTLGTFGLAFAGVALPLLGFFATALGVTGGLTALLALIVFVAVAFAFVFTVIRIAFALQALMIEDVGALDALKRSWFLLGGSMLRLIGWMIVFALILGLGGLIFEVAGIVVAFVVAPPHLSFTTVSTGFGPGFSATVSVFAGIGGAVFQPLIMIGATLLYLEIRWRHGEAVPNPAQRTAETA